ncbi:hypothetical protein Hte_005667 [Hypoxylon texense]
MANLKLEYTTVVLWETLRIFPPAGALRCAVANGFPIDSQTGAKIPMVPDAHAWSVFAPGAPRPARFPPSRDAVPPPRLVRAGRPRTPAGTRSGPFEKGPAQPRRAGSWRCSRGKDRPGAHESRRAIFGFVVRRVPTPGEGAPTSATRPFESAAEELRRGHRVYGRGVRDGVPSGPSTSRGTGSGRACWALRSRMAGVPGRIYFRE